ncbi:MAG: diguanylate cyclase [Armatimonadota bacterium]
MKTVRDIMTTDVVWISPSARVKTAVVLMKGHNLEAIPVIDTNEVVVGIVTTQSVLGVPDNQYVTEIMDTNFCVLDPDVPVSEAAEILQEHKTSHALVLDKARLAGTITNSDLIPELGHNYDPLTGLPYSDTFREWAMNALKRGQEICILFFDMDDFGQFNKKHGHVTGDLIIKEVANVIKQGIHKETDYACRYGGDEFAVVTIRLEPEARRLAEALQSKMFMIDIPEIEERISVTFGIAGGRRTRERDDMHYAATIDNLITKASKDCLAHKKTAGQVLAWVTEDDTKQESVNSEPEVKVENVKVHKTLQASARLKIENISLSITDADVSVSVSLKKGLSEYKRTSSGYVVDDRNILKLVAEATAGAVCSSIPEGHGIIIDDVVSYKMANDDTIITVACLFISPQNSVKTIGSAVIKRGDRFRATAAAVLSAVNRLIEAIPAASSE